MLILLFFFLAFLLFSVPSLWVCELSALSGSGVLKAALGSPGFGISRFWGLPSLPLLHGIWQSSAQTLPWVAVGTSRCHHTPVVTLSSPRALQVTGWSR